MMNLAAPSDTNVIADHQLPRGIQGEAPERRFDSFVVHYAALFALNPSRGH